MPMACLERMEAARIHAWRKLARAALECPGAETALLILLEKKPGKLAEFLDANGDQIYQLPPHLAGPTDPPSVFSE